MMVGESIKRLREAHGMTQAELGRVADVTPMAVSQWENGRSVPRMGAIQRMADHFGVPKSTIMGDRMDPAQAQTIVDFSAQQMTLPEMELVMCYRNMPRRFRELLLENARAYAESAPDGDCD